MLGYVQRSPFKLVSAGLKSLISETFHCPYLTPPAEKPKVFASVLSQNVYGAFRCSQATVGRGAIDPLTVVLKLQISRSLKARLILLYYNPGVLS